MRKLTLQFKPNDAVKKEQKSLFKDDQTYEILETLKVDLEKGTCVDLIECTLKEDISIHDLIFIGNNEILSVLKSEGNKHTCLVKYQETADFKDLFNSIDLNIIFTKPIIITIDKTTVSCIGDQESLLKLIEIIKTKVGKIENMIFKKAVYQTTDILSILTDKQREILLTAHKYGFFEFPRKITSERLSEKVKISKATMLEHIRKAERRLLTEILEGYTA
ncbi:MAG: helix-turn-helix domain-containing protein [Thermoplasmata archaeon]|nr:MAG: helix-turn-helix domain-containing protein [Thermoplasmata archaeon]